MTLNSSSYSLPGLSVLRELTERDLSLLEVELLDFVDMSHFLVKQVPKNETQESETQVAGSEERNTFMPSEFLPGPLVNLMAVLPTSEVESMQREVVLNMNPGLTVGSLMNVTAVLPTLQAKSMESEVVLNTNPAPRDNPSRIELVRALQCEHVLASDHLAPKPE